MAILQIEHTVRDFDAWKQAFDNDPVGREQGGVRALSRAADDPKFVVIELEFDSAAGAEAFAERLRELWERVGGELGLERRKLRILETVEAKKYSADG
jgi:hypothetical protein